MTRITLDAAISTQFQDLTKPVELCDPTGRVMGRFVPVIDMSQWEPVSPEVTEEELDRRENETESFTTAEVLAHLETRPSPSYKSAYSVNAKNSRDTSMKRIWRYLLAAPIVAMTVFIGYCFRLLFLAVIEGQECSTFGNSQ